MCDRWRWVTWSGLTPRTYQGSSSCCTQGRVRIASRTTRTTLWTSVRWRASMTSQCRCRTKATNCLTSPITCPPPVRSVPNPCGTCSSPHLPMNVNVSVLLCCLYLSKRHLPLNIQEFVETCCLIFPNVFSRVSNEIPQRSHREERQRAAVQTPLRPVLCQRTAVACAVAGGAEQLGDAPQSQDPEVRLQGEQLKCHRLIRQDFAQVSPTLSSDLAFSCLRVCIHWIGGDVHATPARRFLGCSCGVCSSVSGCFSSTICLTIVRFAENTKNIRNLGALTVVWLVFYFGSFHLLFRALFLCILILGMFI